MKNIFFVIGATNAGKSTFMQTAKDYDHHTVEVGNMMRAKYLDPKSPHYDPDHFKGQSNPKHTADEAWKMMVDGIVAAPPSVRNIFIDGQPRDVKQCDDICTFYEHGSMWQGSVVTYVHIYATREVREARARLRDADKPDALALALKRLDGDAVGLYEVLARLTARRADIYTINTDTATKATYAFHIQALETRANGIRDMLPA